jgi:hypothetical protein
MHGDMLLLRKENGRVKVKGTLKGSVKVMVSFIGWLKYILFKRN